MNPNEFLSISAKKLFTSGLQDLIFDFGDQFRNQCWTMNYPKGIPNFRSDSKSLDLIFFKKIIFETEALSDFLKDLLLGVEIGDLYDRKFYRKVCNISDYSDGEEEELIDSDFNVDDARNTVASSDTETETDSNSEANSIYANPRHGQNRKRDNLDLFSDYLIYALTRFTYTFAEENTFNEGLAIKQGILKEIISGVQKSIFILYQLEEARQDATDCVVTTKESKMYQFMAKSYFPRGEEFFNRVCYFLLPFFYHEMHQHHWLFRHKEHCVYTIDTLKEIINGMKFEIKLKTSMIDSSSEETTKTKKFDYRDLFLTYFIANSHKQLENSTSSGILLPKGVNASTNVSDFNRVVLLWEKSGLDINEFDNKRSLLPFSKIEVDKRLDRMERGQYAGVYDSIVEACVSG